VAGRRNTAYKDEEPERGLATCAHFHSRPHRQRYNLAGEFYTVTFRAMIAMEWVETKTLLRTAVLCRGPPLEERVYLYRVLGA
jgi:hypothetical protein